MPPFEMAAGQLNKRLHVQSRGFVDDGFGNQIPAGDFETRFTVWVKLLPLKGTESVMASRLEGRQPYIITIRQSTESRQIGPAWQFVDASKPARIFAITAPPTDPDNKRAWFEILATENAVS